MCKQAAVADAFTNASCVQKGGELHTNNFIAAFRLRCIIDKYINRKGKQSCTQACRNMHLHAGCGLWHILLHI